MLNFLSLQLADSREQIASLTQIQHFALNFMPIGLFAVAWVTYAQGTGVIG